MEYTYLSENINSPNEIIPKIVNECKSGGYCSDIVKQLDPKQHKVNDPAIRRDKWVQKPNGLYDSEGKPMTALALEPVNRISIPYQQLIAGRSATFLAGNGVDFKSTAKKGAEKTLYDAVVDAWEDNKLDYRNLEIAETTLSETECAEIWYSHVNEDKTISMKSIVYKPSEGYTLYPVFDGNRDMVAFGLEYEVSGEGNDKKRFCLYTKDELRKYKQSGSGWELLESEQDKPNPAKLLYGKLPVIYFSQKVAVWDIVQCMIERLEFLMSNFGDTNDYNGSPILAASGEVLSFSSKGEAGKIVELGQGAKLEYVTWEDAPESIKLEMDTLDRMIFTCTQTPNISFEQLRGLGDVSGVAFQRIMIDAYLKAEKGQKGWFGECIQRRLNFLIAACRKTTPSIPDSTTIRIKPSFTRFSVEDQSERIENALKANGGKPVIGRLESIKMAGLVEDPDAELKAIEAETEKKEPITE